MKISNPKNIADKLKIAQDNLLECARDLAEIELENESEQLRLLRDKIQTMRSILYQKSA